MLPPDISSWPCREVSETSLKSMLEAPQANPALHFVVSECIKEGRISIQHLFVEIG